MTTPTPLHVIIIGAGLAGLATALSTKLANPSHRVTVLESVKELQEVGAGLQITPNGTRLLSTWGLTPHLTPLASIPPTLSIHRYDGTALLAHEPALQQTVLSRYGHPFWDLHRVDLQQALVSRCVELGVIIRLGCPVVRVGPREVELASGEVVPASVVVLCDGLWSALREQIAGKPCPAKATGDLAYRLVLEVDEEGGGSKAEAGVEEMRERFKGWDPVLHGLLGRVKGRTVHKWRLMWLEALTEWADEKGRVYMAGDCCHPMLPYLAQGANSSLEDGAVLGCLLGKVLGDEDEQGLGRVGRVYQACRKGRGERIQMEGFRQRDDIHLADGEAQRKRDEVFARNLVKEEVEAGFPSRWTCPEVQGFLWGYDAYADAERGWKEDLERGVEA